VISSVAVIAPVAAVVLAGVALSLTTVWMRPGTFFGVRVAAEYPSSAEARETRRRFLIAVWAATAAAVVLAVLAFAVGMLALFVVGTLVQLGAAMLAFRSAWRRTARQRVEAPTTRTATLIAPELRVPGGAPALLGPFLVVGGACIALLVKWNSIPTRFPIHWDIQGQANGWSDRTAAGVFGPLLIAAVILAGMCGLVLFQKRGVRRASAASGVYRRNRALLAVPVVVMWVIASMFAIAALTPLILVNGRFPIPPLVMIAIPVAGVAAAIWLVYRSSSEPDDTAPDNTPDECWRWGMFYHNPDDASIMVEKRFGVGYTLNFARWQSWALMGGIIALPIAIIVIATR